MKTALYLYVKKTAGPRCRGARRGELKGFIQMENMDIDMNEALFKLARENEQTPLKIFISYSSDDKVMVGKLKASLEWLGFSVFIAHEDIEPSKEWQDEIVQNLLSSDVFIPVLTKNFELSNWTDQETGMAYSSKKLIIPLNIDLVPYGFIGRFQHLKVSPEYLEDAAIEILETVRNCKPDFADRMTDHVIDKFEQSGSYAEAAMQSRVIAHMKKLSRDDVNRIAKAALVNSQIRHSWGAAANVRFFLDTYSKLLEKENFVKLNEIYQFAKVA